MKKVPEINDKSGLSEEYRLAYGNLSGYLKRIKDRDHPRTIALAKRAFLHRRILKYSEFFSQNNYIEVATGFNKESVKKIDNIVDKINKFREEIIAKSNTDFDKLSDEDYKTLVSFLEDLNKTVSGIN